LLIKSKPRQCEHVIECYRYNIQSIIYDLTVVRLVAAATEDVSFARLYFLVGDAVSTIVVAVRAMRTTEVFLAVLAAYRVLTNVTHCFLFILFKIFARN